MQERRCDLYVFSGTGNSLLIARQIADIFRSSGMEVHFHSLKSGIRVDSNSDSLLGLVIPVAMQGTYPFIWKLIDDLPQVKGRKVFFADTLGLFSGGIVGSLKKILIRKGYDCVGAKEFFMPHNLLKSRISEERNKKRVKRALKKAKDYAVQILEGKSHWGRLPLLSDLMASLSRGKAVWDVSRKLLALRVDADLCVACGLCARLCPTDNFEIRDISHPKDRCEVCMRCVTFCPKGAITLGKHKNIYHALSSVDLLNPDQK